MKLFIKQKVFSWTDKFTVKDEFGADRYYVEGEFFRMGHHLHIYDAYHNEVAYIQQKLFSFKPRYFLYKGETVAAELVKEITFFRQKYTFNGLPWLLEGRFTLHDYSLTDTQTGLTIMTVGKEWFTWGDSYSLDIADGADEVLCLACVIAVDCANEDSSSH